MPVPAAPAPAALEARQGGGKPSTGPRGRLGVGLGVRGDLEPVEETFDERQRAGVLDEGVEVLTAQMVHAPLGTAPA